MRLSGLSSGGSTPPSAGTASGRHESDYPRVALPGDKPITIPVQAGLRCALGGSQPDVVFLLHVTPTFTGAVTTEFIFFKRIAQTNAPAGDCSKETKAYQEWSFGLRSGKLLCTASSARARVDWIFEGEDLIAWAIRDDSDGVALYQWWVDVGRLILR